MNQFKPKAIVFCCNFGVCSRLDTNGGSSLRDMPNVKIVRVMCSGRVDPAFVLEALRKGIDGVLIAGCHPGDCHYQSGNYKTNRRVKLLKKLLEEPSGLNRNEYDLYTSMPQKDKNSQPWLPNLSLR